MVQNHLKSGSFRKSLRVESNNLYLMKSIKLTVLAVVLSLSTSFAQNLDVRAYAGWNILQLTSDDGESIVDGVLHHRNVSGRPGYQFGAGITFGERFYIQPGLQLATLSTKVVNKNSVTGNELTDETTLKVMSVPLKVGLRLIDPETEDIFNIRLFGGIDGHHVLSVDHSEKSGEFDDITTDDYSNLILNADFGMGVDLFFLYLDIGYQLGLTPVHSGGDQAKGNSFYSNLGIRIKL